MPKVEIRQIDNSSLVNMTVNRFMLQLELPTGTGYLWDPNSVSSVEWGHVTAEGRLFGQVVPHNNGEPRRFFDAALMTPYLNAFHAEAERRGVRLAQNVEFTTDVAEFLAVNGYLHHEDTDIVGEVGAAITAFMADAAEH